MKKAALLLAICLLITALPAFAETDASIAYLNVTLTCGCTRRGCGFMAGKNVMLTAGDNLYCTEHKGRADTVTVRFGRDQSLLYESEILYFYNFDPDLGVIAAQDNIGFIVFKNDLNVPVLERTLYPGGTVLAVITGFNDEGQYLETEVTLTETSVTASFIPRMNGAPLLTDGKVIGMFTMNPEGNPEPIFFTQTLLESVIRLEAIE